MTGPTNDILSVSEYPCALAPNESPTCSTFSLPNNLFLIVKDYAQMTLLYDTIFQGNICIFLRYLYLYQL